MVFRLIGVLGMNIIWFGIIVSSIIIAIFTGKTGMINSSVLTGPAEAVMFCFKLMGNICLWLGIMKIAEKADLTFKVSKLVKPFIRMIFPGIPEKHPAFDTVTASLVANMMGIGNAATAFGLKAMKELKKLNSSGDAASNEMCMFIIANSFMIQIIHTNTIFIRKMAGSENPTIVMPGITIATFFTLVTGILITKFFEMIYEKRIKKRI